MPTPIRSRAAAVTAVATAGVMAAALMAGSAAAAPARTAHSPHSGGKAAPAGSPALKVLAGGLHNPRGVTALRDGSVLVAESGMVDPGCAANAACVDRNGSIYRVQGHWQGRVVTGLPSWGLGSGDPQHPASGTGPTDVQPDGRGGYWVLSGFGGGGSLDYRASLGPLGRPLGTIYHAGGGAPVADLVRHETLLNPDWVLGHDVESNPWRFARTATGGWLVTDAAGNDIVRVSRHGRTSTESVLPDSAVPGSGTAPAMAQAVPSGIVQGPDGAYYIADMGGLRTGASRIWRLVPGHRPELFASGFTALIDLAIGSDGNLLALSYTGGYGATGPTPGSLKHIDLRTREVTQVPTGGDLNAPTGLSVGPRGQVYLVTEADPGNGQLLELTG